MKLRLTAILLVINILCCTLSACAKAPQKEKYSAYSLDYFDTATTIVGYAYSQEEFDKVAQEILMQLGEYHKLYSIYHRFEGMENLCTINELVGGQHRTVKVDPRIIDMLLFAKQMYEVTDGMTNVAMGSVLSLWHDYRSLGRDDPTVAALPPTEALQEAALHTDFSNLVIDEQAGTVTLTDPEMTLDVGAVAKGYAIERIALALEEQGVTGYVINVGGNVRTIGAKADGTPWNVGLEDSENGDYLCYLQLNGQSVVTSGSYQRFYIVDGQRYHHIIHPDTLMPSEGYVSVSVVCVDSGLGDALSTALFCMTPEQGLTLVESLEGVEALWVHMDGTQTTSSGWSAYLKP